MPASSPVDLLPSLRAFCTDLTAKFQAQAAGDPEDQLKPPVDALLRAFGDLSDHSLVAKGESQQKGIGRPDFVIVADGLTVGFVELKAPGKGADPDKFTGHDAKQWKSFQTLPNLIYTDGTEWAMFRSGEPEGRPIRLAGKAHAAGKKAAEEKDARDLFDLLQRFTRWTPVVPSSPKGLAAALAPYCRFLKEAVERAVTQGSAPILAVQSDFKRLLFPDGDEKEFADAYAQTVTFALLLARVDGADTLDLDAARKALGGEHGLLAESLRYLTHEDVQAELSVDLGMLQRVTAAVRPDELREAPEAAGGADPWLYFYEDFIAAYDGDLRKRAGVYYTPVEVVRAQVRLIDEALKEELGIKQGFLDGRVRVLDPAVGTGTYLLNVVDHAMGGVSAADGAGMAFQAATNLAGRLFGFEKLVGPYAVAQLRLTQKLDASAGQPLGLPSGIFLTDTLESPHATPVAPGIWEKVLAEEHRKALRVKDAERVMVVLGNPPYRECKKDDGGWVTLGDAEERTGFKARRPIFETFTRLASEAGFGGDVKNAYNLYVFFLRWGLWKVFEQAGAADGPGVLSFITPSSYLTGPGYAGVREHMRRVCDRIDIIDLGGEGKGTRQDDNVFDIQVPVCICVARRTGAADPETPAAVSYTRVEGTRTEKLAMLAGVAVRGSLSWFDAPVAWTAPFLPATGGDFAAWPGLADLFPWQHSGCQLKRAWPIAPDRGTLVARWQSLLQSDEPGPLMRETSARNMRKRCRSLLDASLMRPLADEHDIDPAVRRYGYRSFDAQWLIADARLGDRFRPPLWQAHGPQQIYLSSLFTQPMGDGPALTVAADIPDLHHFRGSYGGADQLPLYRDAAAAEPNLLPGLLELLEAEHGRRPTPEDVAGYAYALLAQPAYTRRFAEELTNREVRLPLTRDGGLFARVAAAGCRLIALHTRGERCPADAPGWSHVSRPPPVSPAFWGCLGGCRLALSFAAGLLRFHPHQPEGALAWTPTA